jgi:MFS family permease
MIALVPVALKAPWFVFSLPAGIVIDRFDRRRLILVADLVRSLAYGAAGLAIWAALPFDAPPLRGTEHAGTFALISLAAILVGAAEVLRDNAVQTMLPAIVDDHALERANGRLWSVEMVMNTFVGTAAAGVLLGVSLALPFGVNACAMALAVALIAGLKGDFRADPGAGPGAAPDWKAELREGITYLMGQPLLRRLAILTGLFNFSFEAMMVTLVLIVQERLGLGPLALSAIMASGAVGGVAAGLVNERIVRRLGRARSLQWSLLGALVFPLAVLAVDQGGLAFLCAAFLVSEFGGIVWNTVSVSYRQRSIPRRLLGRVNSAYRLFAIGMAPVGMLAAGLLTRAVSGWSGREAALAAPFVMALVVLALTVVIYWRYLGRAFDVEPGPAPS